MQLDNEVRAAIQSALLAAEPKSPLPILGHVLLENTPEGFRATGSDTRMQVVRAAPRLAGPDFRICVSAARLAAVLKLGHGDLSATLTEKTLTLRGGQSRFSLPLLPAVDFPLMPRPGPGTEIALDGADLHRALDLVLPFAAYHDVRYYLVGMLVERKTDELRFVATDGAGLAVLRVPSPGPDFALILSRETCKDLRSLLSAGPVRLLVEERRATLVQGPLTMDAATVDGKFPDWRRVLPEKQAGHAVLKAGAAHAVLAEAAMMGEEDAARCRLGRLEIGRSGVTVTAGAADAGTYAGLFECSASVTREVAFRVDSLRDVLALFPRDAEIDLQYPADESAGGTGPFVFRSPAVPGFSAAYMPTRY